MPQFFLAAEALHDKAFHLRGPEADHIVKSLRYGEGQSITLFDGKGRRFLGVIKKIHPDGSVSGDVTAALPGAVKSIDLRLYLGLLKAGHWDYALEKCTELGVSSFVPVLTSRTVVSRQALRSQSKHARWTRVVMAAAKQCQRDVLPAIEAPVDFADAVANCRGKGVSLMAWECFDGPRNCLESALRDFSGGFQSTRVNLFIGPEGGFSSEEAELARASGVALFSLGPRILRAETAALTAVALVQYEVGAI